MQIRYMKEFVAIREYGNISNTARNLYITQPALSRHLAELEKEFGVKLLRRDKHSLEFTEAGLRAYKSFKKILMTYDNLTKELSDYQEGISGKLRLGMLYYTIKQDFGFVLPAFSEKYPGVEIKRYSYQPHEVYAALMEERIDLGVIPKANHPGSEALEFVDIMSGGMEVMMSAKHPLAAKKMLTLDDLRGEVCIRLLDDPVTNLNYEEALEHCGFTMNRVLQTDNVDTVPFLLQKTDAVYIKASGFSVIGFENEIVTRPIEEKNLIVTKSYAYRKDNANPLIPLFLELAQKAGTT